MVRDHPLLSLLMVIALTPMGMPAAQRMDDPAELLQRAVQAHQAGEYQVAVGNYRAFLSRYPEYADVRSNLGAAYAALGDHPEAIEQYEEALRLGNSSDPVEVRFNLALAYYKSAEMVEAVSLLREVLRKKPDHKRAALLLADCYLIREEHEKVIALLSPFEGQLGGDKALAYLLGTALIRTGEMGRGQQMVDLILSDGDSAEARLLMGTAHLMVRDIPAAIEEFEKAVELNPHLPSANAFLGKALRESGRVDEGLPYLRRELEINPNDFDSNLFVGVYLYKREQRYEEALEHFRRALKIRPRALEVRFQIALVYVLQDKTEEALRMIEEIVEEAPDFLEGHVTLTRLYYRLQRREDAERHRNIVEELRKRKDEATVKEFPADSGP